VDVQRFDRLTRSFAAPASRRGLMRGLAALGVGSAVLGPSGARARRAPLVADRSGPSSEGTDAICKGKPAISNKSCSFTACGTNCACAVSTSGKKKCVQFSGGITCPIEDECNRSGDCAAGEVCIKVGKCCEGRKFNQCASQCV
jgi:hypothetical protein